jgi:hypothetical protein
VLLQVLSLRPPPSSTPSADPSGTKVRVLCPPPPSLAPVLVPVGQSACLSSLPGVIQGYAQLLGPQHSALPSSSAYFWLPSLKHWSLSLDSEHCSVLLPAFLLALIPAVLVRSQARHHLPSATVCSAGSKHSSLANDGGRQLSEAPSLSQASAALSASPSATPSLLPVRFRVSSEASPSSLPTDVPTRHREMDPASCCWAHFWPQQAPVHLPHCPQYLTQCTGPNQFLPVVFPVCRCQWCPVLQLQRWSQRLPSVAPVPQCRPDATPMVVLKGEI